MDVIVVGAGPAGAATALLLARAGYEVALLDRQTFPRAKPCGDCLSAGAARVLDRLGLLQAVEAERPARLEGWRITAPGGHAFEARFALVADGDQRVATAIALARQRLDRVLLEGARRAGADFRPGIHVTDLLRDPGGRVVGVTGRGPDGAPATLRARLVVGADGLRSIVARRLGLIRRPPRLRKLSLTAHLHGVRGIGRLGEMHLAAGACAGLAPVEDAPGDTACCNLTLVVDAARFGAEARRDPTGFYWRTLARFPGLARRLDDARPAGTDPRPLLASGPFDWPTRTAATHGAALVGDAAGYYDPFTGQGIHLALASAEILAEEADAALRSGDLRLRRYARRHARLLRGTRALQHLIELVVSRPRLADAAIRRLARNPSAAHALIATTAGLRPPRSLLSRPLLLSFLFGSPLRDRPA